MKKLVLVLIMSLLTACGADQVIESTNSMPGKMDNMTVKMDETNEKMDSMTEKMDETNEKMDSMTSKIDETNEAVRLQKLSIAKDGMEDPVNAEKLVPFPTRIVPFAELFAYTANRREILGQVYLYLKEVNDVITIPAVDETGMPKEFSAQEIQDINNEKFQIYTAAQAISAHIPQEMLEEIVTEEIYKEGRFQETAYNILMMRYQFLRDAMLTNSLLSQPTESTGVIKDAVTYLTFMDWIARRPFLEDIEVKVTGLLPPAETVHEQLTPVMVKESMLSMISTVMNRANQVEKVVQANDTITDDQKLSQQPSLKAQLTQDQAQLQELENYWSQQ